MLLIMALSTEPYKGTRDFYPDDMRFRNWMFGKLAETAKSYGFQEYGGPMLEPFELYAAKTGEEIVNQQLYWLTDKGERKLAVRPEMTPTLARMVAGKIHELPRPIRLFSIPNLWRYERPQRGRLREHWQLNMDILGGDPLFAETEILSVAYDLIRAFGGGPQMQIRVNHRGIIDTFFKTKMGLSADQAHKVVKAIDAKDKIGDVKFKEWLTEAGVSGNQIQEITDFFVTPLDQLSKSLPCEGVEHLLKLLGAVKEAIPECPIVFDPTIMRGLDYYTGTVFEIYDTSPENRRAMFGGGRYDNLMGIFGKEALSGVGFGMGDVSLQHFLETHKLVPELPSDIDVFVSLPKPELRATADKLARELRSAGLKVMTPLSVGGFGAQLKQATKFNARFVVLFGDDELKRGEVLVKDLKSGVQKTVPINQVKDAVAF